MDLHVPAYLKLLIPLAGCAVILLRFGRKDILAPNLFWPPARAIALWTFLGLAWMLGTDAIVNWRGPFDFGPWRAAPPLNSLFRVLGVGIAGPAMEELIFRGFLFGRLLRTKLGGTGTLLITSAVWAVLHWDYSVTVIAI